MILRRDREPSRKRRLTFAILLALAVAPGTFARTDVPTKRADILTLTPVDDLPGEAAVDGFRREGVWALNSPNIDFGGFSALLILGRGGLLRSFSDRGAMMTFGAPGSTDEGHIRFTSVWDRGHLSSRIPDIESATRDSGSGDYWLGFEGRHAVIRYSVASVREAVREPPEWIAWPVNAGAEAMARLPDGRFLVLPERSSQGLLYAGDPAQETAATGFSFTLPQGLNATELAALPDGRVLVLLRRVTWAYPPFTAALGIADPSGLEEGDELPVELLLDLDRLLPRENYEGLAVEPQADGSLVLWIIADDNLATFQRTLLAKLVWHPAKETKPNEKARED